MKPPELPMPGTGGGGSAMMKASSMLCRLPNSWPMILPADSPALSRLSKSLNGAKITPALLALVKVAPEKPAKATASCTPGVLRMISEAFWITASVRSSEAPSGSCTTTIA